MLDAPDTAVLAVNLGTPETPTAPAVRRYLAEFLSDRRVVAIPPLLWQPLLRGLILPLRSSRSAAKYAQVWLPDGSPLMVHTRQLAQAMQALLPTLTVRHAMRYGEPALAGELDRLAAEGAPHRGAAAVPAVLTTTTASVEDRVDAWQRRNPA
jgi:ferrochelatase